MFFPSQSGRVPRLMLVRAMQLKVSVDQDLTVIVILFPLK